MTETLPDGTSAVARIPDGARIVVPPGPAVPGSLIRALGERPWQRGIDLFCGAGRLPREVLENERIRISDWQFAGAARDLYRSGRIEYVPLRYSDFPRAFGINGPLRPDVLLLQTPAPNVEGRVSPGLSGALGLDVIKDVPLVIAEWNARLPFTKSPILISRDDIDVAVSIDEQPPRSPRPTVSPTEQAVARNVAGVVADGATLQFGTGSVVEATLSLLGDHRELGIHSGMVTEGIMPLMRSGAISNRRKGYLDGRTVAGMVFGSSSFLEFIANNDEFLVVPASISHGIDVVMQVESFTTINSAIEVDLSGQVNAEFLHGSQFSGVGGQADYTFAGSTSTRPGSKSIIAMPSTGADGFVSRIVPMLCEGAVVTTPRYCVDFVVTEYGVADLRFKNLRERSAQLTKIAHPAHREALERASSASRRSSWPSC